MCKAHRSPTGLGRSGRAGDAEVAIWERLWNKHYRQPAVLVWGEPTEGREKTRPQRTDDVGNLRRLAGWHNGVRPEGRRASDGSAPGTAVSRARDTSRRGSRTRSRSRAPPAPGAVTGGDPDAQLPDDWYKILAERERDSNRIQAHSRISKLRILKTILSPMIPRKPLSLELSLKRLFFDRK